MAKKILIVEDNDLNLKLFRDLLGANGYETYETKEGIEAISITRNVQPDLIVRWIYNCSEISGPRCHPQNQKWIRRSSIFQLLL